MIIFHKIFRDTLTLRLRQYHRKVYTRSIWIRQYHHPHEHRSLSKKFCLTHPSCGNQVPAARNRGVSIKSDYSGPHKLSCRNMSSGHQRLDPKQASRRRKLTLATYLSGAIGAILLSAIGVRYYRQVKRRATGIEDIKLEEYSFGRRAWLYKYRGFVFPNLFLDKIRNIHTFDVREDDVWVITFPKSGKFMSH